jgi:alpha-tubulin suppressor-like RCC1 family protein
LLLTKKENNELFALGNNHYQQMGTELPNQLLIATKLPLTCLRSDEIVTHFTCAFSFSVVVTNARYIYILGQDWITSAGNMHGLTLDTDDPIETVSAGSFHTVILTRSGKAYSGGESSSKTDRGVVKSMNRDFGPMHSLRNQQVNILKARNDYTVAITSSGEVHVFGALIQKAGLIATFPHISSIELGTKHFALMTRNGELYMIGSNSQGEIVGEDETQVRTYHDFVKANLQSGTKAIRAACGDSFTIVYFSGNVALDQQTKLFSLLLHEKLCDLVIL